MSNETPPRSRFHRWTDTAHLITYIGIVAVISILSLVIALTIQARSAHLLRSAICDTFSDVAASPVTPQTTELGHRLIRDTKHGADVAECPKKKELPR